MQTVENPPRNSQGRNKAGKITLITVIVMVCLIAAGAFLYQRYKSGSSGENTLQGQEETGENAAGQSSGDDQADSGQTVTKKNTDGDENAIMESGTVSMETSEVRYDLTITTDDDDDSTSSSSSSSSSDSDDDTDKTLKIETVYVAQGQRIQEGDKLFKLTDASVRSVRRILESNEASAAATLAEAQSEETLKVQTAANTRSASETEAAVADDVYTASVEELQNRLSSYAAANEQLAAEIESCQNKIWDSDFREKMSAAKTKMESAKIKLSETDVTNVVAYAANESAYETAKSAYESYTDQIDNWNEIIEKDTQKTAQNAQSIDRVTKALEYKLQEAENTRQSAKLSGQLAQETYDETVTSLQETVTEAQNAYEEAAQELADFNAFVGDDGIVYADGSGLVTAVNYEAGDRLKTKGAMVTYVKSNGYRISVDVSEEDIPQISVGDTVSIVMTAYPEETYTGTVKTISTSRSGSYSATVSYPVEIEIQGDTSKLYGGMTAEVTFESTKGES